MKLTVLLLLAALSCPGRVEAASSSRLPASIKVIRAVGPEGHGNAEATQAWKALSTSDAGSLLIILAAMDGANDLAVNWLRAAVDTIAGRELAAGRKLPVASLEKFVGDTTHHPRARRLAYELIAQANPDSAHRLITGLRDDPSTELRRDAVQRLTDEAAALSSAGRTNEAVPKYQTAIQSARDVDQVESIAKELKQLGHPVELPVVFGWVTHWKVIGPFDSSAGAGHDTVYPPEKRIELAAEYDGKAGKVRWQDFTAVGDYGLVDLNKPCGALKEVAGYAYTEFHADKARSVEVRLGCKNAWKVWLNGKLLFGRDEYHRGMEIDQYRMTGELRPGKNSILVKICQNEQKEDWTKEWEFQLRITDALGTPIASAKP
ncbi:MAG TPA: hypothetical protein VGK40_06810 [Verrucomicrobiae bacterium]